MILSGYNVVILQKKGRLIMKKKLKSLIGLLLAGALCLTGCGGGSAAFTDEAVMKIDGHEIMKSEYMVYLYTTTMSFVSAAGEDVWNMDFDGQTADELVEERTISTIQSVIAAKGKYLFTAGASPYLTIKPARGEGDKPLQLIKNFFEALKG